MPDLAIVMPVFNERATVQKAINDVLDAELPVADYELLVVDDGSTDGTGELLQTNELPPPVRVLAHERNRGKGAAIKTGLAAASAAWTVIMDADLEYDPADLAVVLDPLVRGEAEVVFGARTFKSHTAFNFWYVVGNKGLTLTANLLFNTWLSDIMTCYKAMPTELFRSLDLRENGFAIEPEIVARVLRHGIQIYEVPVSYRARRREEGKKLSAMDGLRVLRTLVRCRIASSR